jgi:hypothetical protein
VDALHSYLKEGSLPSEGVAGPEIRINVYLASLVVKDPAKNVLALLPLIFPVALSFLSLVFSSELDYQNLEPEPCHLFLIILLHIIFVQTLQLRI